MWIYHTLSLHHWWTFGLLIWLFACCWCELPLQSFIWAHVFTFLDFKLKSRLDLEVILQWIVLKKIKQIFRYYSIYISSIMYKFLYIITNTPNPLNAPTNRVDSKTLIFLSIFYISHCSPHLSSFLSALFYRK